MKLNIPTSKHILFAIIILLLLSNLYLFNLANKSIVERQQIEDQKVQVEMELKDLQAKVDEPIPYIDLENLRRNIEEIIISRNTFSEKIENDYPGFKYEFYDWEIKTNGKVFRSTISHRLLDKNGDLLPQKPGLTGGSDAIGGKIFQDGSIEIDIPISEYPKSFQ